jgi:hypothetical protein
MAMESSSANSKITDSETEANVQVIGESPSVAIGSLNQSMAFSIGIALQNAVFQQQSSNVITQATTAKCVEILIKK